MICRELNLIQCKTYLVGCEQTRKALLIDPERSHLDRYLAMLAYEHLVLEAIVDTHTHADHASGAAWLHDLTGAPLVMHQRAPTPRATQHVEHNDVIRVGDLSARVLYTPGHTPDSISLYVAGHVFTGDVLLIGGTGRTDFAGGDSGQQYDSIVEQLFSLPDETLVYPGHDYRGNTVSTIARERKSNPRIAGRTRQEYIELMASIDFPLPQKIQEVLQPNQSAIDDDKINFPNLAELNEVRQIEPRAVHRRLCTSAPPLLIDVRESREYHGELGHIAGSRLIPLRELSDKIDSLLDFQQDEIVVVCRSGVRSTTAAAILTGMGFRQVSNLKGGMVDWVAQSLPVEQ